MRRKGIDAKDGGRSRRERERGVDKTLRGEGRGWWRGRRDAHLDLGVLERPATLLREHYTFLKH